MNDDVLAVNQPKGAGTAKLIYVLYLIGIVIGITSIVGVIMAYVNKSDAPDWLKTHYQFQIRTFWIGALYGVIGVLLTFILVGYLVLLFSVIWLVVRCVKGLKHAENATAVPNAKTWLF